MAFESLSERLNQAFKNISGKGKLSEKNMNDMLREVRMSLLEADVNYGVVKDFIESVKEKALGEKVMDSLNPSQMVVKIVHDEIASLLGEKEAKITYRPFGITTVMMVGLQGTGKTTAAAKIANVIRKKQNRKVMLVACDLVRPAAIDQLKTLGASINVEVFSMGLEVSALKTAQLAMTYAQEKGYDTIIFDTAGRLHIDEALMQELKDIKGVVQPDDILLTVDAMTGQDIVQVAQSFHEQLDVTGLVLTKTDGDSRGGGILSVRAITGVPVKFVGTGEKIDDLDIFYPDRMADRILGMGDIMTLVEEAQAKMDIKESEKSANRLMSGQFDMNDMLSQLQQIKKMGSMGKILKMIPGMGQMANQINEVRADKTMGRNEAIILSMTAEERLNPVLMKAGRKNRIAKGSGVQVADVNRLITQFNQMKDMMKMAKNGGMPAMPGMPSMGGSRKPGVSKAKAKKSKKKKR